MSAVVINIDTSLTDVPTIEVGKQGENGATQVVFDVSEMIETYGSGTAYVVVQRRGDAEPYLLDNTSQSGDTVTWTVSNVDTDVYGTGRVQLFWLINEQVAKTVTYQFYVEEALHDPQDAPVVPGGWISDEIGNLDNLTTTAKANLVAAINEVNSKAATNTTAIGTLANLTTTEKSNLVGAINEVNEDVSDVKEDLGDLSNLETEDKSNLVAAINEASQSGGSSLTPTQKQTLMDVVNIIGAFTVEDAQDYIDAFNEAWNVSVTGIRLNKSSITFDGFGSEQLRAILIPNDAIGTVTWSSSNSNVVTVSSNGLVEPVANGSCTVTASCSGFTASCAVTASNIPQIFTVTSSLSHCTSSNTRTTVVEGSSYVTNIIADTGYEMSTITCTMGGIAQTVNDGAINIANVTGNIIINATAEAETTYISGNGLEYTKRFTIAEPNGTIATVLSRYGTMEELEELTITGLLLATNSTGSINSGALNIGTYCPKLKKLIIAPTLVKYSNSTLTQINTGHYAFSGIPASLTYIQLGSINETIKARGGGYFRNDGTSAGLSGNTNLGNTNGLELVIYTDTYRDKGGFTGTVENTTVIKEYLYTDGSVLAG